MAVKKVTPRAPAAKKASGSKAAATRVTKRAMKRVAKKTVR